MNIRTRLLASAMTGFLVAAISTVAHAQDGDESAGTAMKVTPEMLQGLLQQMQIPKSGQISISASTALTVVKAPVQVTPEVIEVDSKKNTATVTFTNPNDDSVRTDLSMQYTVPAKQPNTVVAKFVYTNGTSAKQIAAPGAGAALSLESWINDLPKQLVLKGHETRVVTLHLTVPTSLKSGEYSAHMVAATKPVPKITLQMNPVNDEDDAQ